jgi:antitoxin component of RelBE/YafQ-DinJ toxin-antitoxin module
MTTQIVFNIDPAVKAKAMKRAKHLGVPFASVLKMATKAFAEGKFNVEMVPEEKFNPKTRRIIDAALRDIEQGKNLKTFKSQKDLDDYLLSI